jgi:hypothetical protein
VAFKPGPFVPAFGLLYPFDGDIDELGVETEGWCQGKVYARVPFFCLFD